MPVPVCENVKNIAPVWWDLVSIMGAEHEIRVRVRYADTDTMRVVYYANYFIWFESGRIELLRSRGIVYRDIEEMASSYLSWRRRRATGPRRASTTSCSSGRG